MEHFSNLKSHTRYSSSFSKVSKKGCQAILQHYFYPTLTKKKSDKVDECKKSIKDNKKDLLMFPTFELDEQNNVILELFLTGIPVHIDDISGSLRIGYKSLS